MQGHAPSSPWHTIGGVSRGPVTSDSGPPAAPASILDAPIGFSERDGAWLCDGVSLAAIAREVGTPCYVYSAALIRARYTRLTAALSGCRHSVHYALKANSTLGLVRLIQGLGASADCNSVGEIEVALKAGFAPAPDRLHRRRQERRRDRAGGRPRPQGHQRRIARRAGAHRRRVDPPGPAHPGGAAGEPRRRRQEPSAHLDRDAPQQVRRADRRGAAAARRHGAAARPRGGRRPRPRRLADHHARAAVARRGADDRARRRA